MDKCRILYGRGHIAESFLPFLIDVRCQGFEIGIDRFRDTRGKRIGIDPVQGFYQSCHRGLCMGHGPMTRFSRGFYANPERHFLGHLDAKQGNAILQQSPAPFV